MFYSKAKSSSELISFELKLSSYIYQNKHLKYCFLTEEDI